MIYMQENANSILYLKVRWDNKKSYALQVAGQKQNYSS